MIQLFIENRLYQRIEACETYEAVQQAVLKGLHPFRNQLTREITMEDVEMLLSLQIKRISRFDLKKNEQDKLKIHLELKEVEKHLKKLINYAIDYLQRLIDKYGKQYKRKTHLTTAEEIDVRELTANELAIVYDQERGFLGHQLKGEPAFRCSPLDRLLLVWDNGRYQMIAPPDKFFVDKNLAYFGIFDREKIFTLVYSTSKATFLKRFAFGGAIMNRDYNCAVGKRKAKTLDRSSSHRDPAEISTRQRRPHRRTIVFHQRVPDPWPENPGKSVDQTNGHQRDLEAIASKVVQASSAFAGWLSAWRSGCLAE